MFDSSYGGFHGDVQAAVRRGAFGADIGQTSWLMAADWRGYLRWLELSTTSRLLDVACGSGGPAVVAAVETGCHVVGVDVHADGVAAGTRLAAERGVAGRARFEVVDATGRLPFDDASFDAVTCIDAMNHLADRPAVLAEYRRVLRPGGRVVYTDPVVVTGAVSNHELALRSSIGFFLFTPDGHNERLLAEAGFVLDRREDSTGNVADVADRWGRARAGQADGLRRTEGDDTFEGQQRFFRQTAVLAAEGRLSRHTFYVTRR